MATEALLVGLQTCKTEQVCCGGTATQPCSEECRAILFLGGSVRMATEALPAGFLACKAEQVCTGRTATLPCSDGYRAILFF